MFYPSFADQEDYWLKPVLSTSQNEALTEAGKWPVREELDLGHILHAGLMILFFYIYKWYSHTHTTGGDLNLEFPKVSAPLTSGRSLISISDLINAKIFEFCTEGKTDVI